MSREMRFGELELTWLGHAGFMLRAAGKVLYIDPYKVSHGDKADIILITHDHYDHLDPGSISSISKEDTVLIAPKACKEKLKGMKEIKPGNLIEEQGINIMAVPAYNRSKQFHPRGSGVGYVLTMGGKTVYHAGDTDSIPEMSDLGDVDIALLPVGGTYTMDAREAAEAADRIGAEVTIPMHWGGIVGTRDDAEELRKATKSKVVIME